MLEPKAHKRTLCSSFKDFDIIVLGAICRKKIGTHSFWTYNVGFVLLIHKHNRFEKGVIYRNTNFREITGVCMMKHATSIDISLVNSYCIFYPKFCYASALTLIPIFVHKVFNRNQTKSQMR